MFANVSTTLPPSEQSLSPVSGSGFPPPLARVLGGSSAQNGPKQKSRGVTGMGVLGPARGSGSSVVSGPRSLLYGEQLSVPLSLRHWPSAESWFPPRLAVPQNTRSPRRPVRVLPSSRWAFGFIPQSLHIPLAVSSPRVCCDQVGQSSNLIRNSTCCLFHFLKQSIRNLKNSMKVVRPLRGALGPSVEEIPDFCSLRWSWSKECAPCRPRPHGNKPI